MFVRWNHYQRQDDTIYWNAALVEAGVQTLISGSHARATV